MTATISPRTHKYTIEDFNALPVGPPYYEFDEGELIPVPSPTITHQDIVSVLDASIRPYTRTKKLGRVIANVDVFLPDGRVYVPDLGIARYDQVSPVDGKIHGAPILVVEVMSSDETRDRTHKFHVYVDSGVEWYWLITQSLIIEEYHAIESGYVRVSSIAPGEVFRPQLLPGIEIDLAALLGDTEQPAQADSSEQPG